MAISERPTFYEEQYLTAEDLIAAVDYGRIQQARHALGAHTWGIAAGLQLKETPEPGGGLSIYVLPGYAVDGYGRPIVVLSPYRIPEERFSAIKAQLPPIDPKGKLIQVWLAYDESAQIRPYSDLCRKGVNSSRIHETFRIEVGEVGFNAATSGINLAGRSLSDPRTALKEFDASAPLLYDGSVPHQDLAELQPRARWLVPLGYVRWLAKETAPGQFVARDDSGPEKDSDKIRKVRRYVGVVAEDISAADGAIRFRSRSADPALSKFEPPKLGQTDNDLVWVEGNLRIAGRARLCAGDVDFRDAAGSDLDTPMFIRRSDVTPGAHALQVAIGPKAQTTNRFAVVTLDGEKVEEKFVITSGGNAGLGTSDPTDKLHVVGDFRLAGAARKLGGGGWTIQSDSRLKKDVVPITEALEKLLQLHGFNFEWRDPERMGNLSGPQMGLVAQEVEKVFPEWVSKDSQGYSELTLRGFEALVIEALRELKLEVDDLKTRLQNLEQPKRATRKKPAKKTRSKTAT
ncbi:MAG TPA: tail fiber domain-containing protein [Pyrinomonadaceae bacterium]|nr:tail fiber domain-containing protein [Pyrinomonadaceae bacterium]